MLSPDQPRSGDGRFSEKSGSAPDVQLTTLSRDEILDGLREVGARLHQRGESSTIHLVGGVAVSLNVDSNRPPTSDVDVIEPSQAFREVALEVGEERGWPLRWLDEDAHIFMPDGFAQRGAEWETVSEMDGLTIQVGSSRMLLAMKLRAMENRPRRDAPDVRALIAACSITSADEAEQLLGEYFAGEELSPRAYNAVELLFEDR